MLFCSKSRSFTPAKDMPSLAGKVILVTGGNIGLGKQCALEYARHGPAELWLAARNLDKARAAVDEIKQQVSDDDAQLPPIKLVEMDLSSLESVKDAARTITASVDRLDILMLNAGIMAAPPGLTKDGHELQFGTNYLGHALLAKLLLPLLEKTAALPGGADVRIVTLSSDGHGFAPKTGIQFDSLRTSADSLGPYGRYGQSKLAMILWARRAAQLYPQFTTASIHPGVVQTNLLSSATGSSWIVLTLAKAATTLLTPVDQGVWNQLWASVSKDVKSGEYYTPVGVENRSTAHGKNDELAKQLWEWTEKELEGYSL